MNNSAQQRAFVFIGSYAEPDSPGVYVCSYNSETGALLLMESVDGLKNPTYLDIDQNALRLYALAEGINADGQRYGEAYAYSFDANSGQLTFLNKETTVPSPTCHIVLDRTHRNLLVSSY